MGVVDQFGILGVPLWPVAEKAVELPLDPLHQLTFDLPVHKEVIGATQVWPAQRLLPQAIRRAAKGMSAVESHNTGLLPPIPAPQGEMLTGCGQHFLPTWLLPVKR